MQGEDLQDWHTKGPLRKLSDRWFAFNNFTGENEQRLTCPATTPNRMVSLETKNTLFFQD